MNPEITKALSEIKALTEENNKILHAMRRSQMWGRIFSFLYWIIIIGLTLGAYYAIQPYLESVVGSYQGLVQGVEGVQNIGNQIPNLQSILDSIKP